MDRITVDYRHIEEIKRLECVTGVETEPKVKVTVRSEMTPDFDTIAYFGDKIEVETRRRCPWVREGLHTRYFGRVFAGKRLMSEREVQDD